MHLPFSPPPSWSLLIPPLFLAHPRPPMSASFITRAWFLRSEGARAGERVEEEEWSHNKPSSVLSFRSTSRSSVCEGEMNAASGINCTPLLKISKFALLACWSAIWLPTRWTLWLMLPTPQLFFSSLIFDSDNWKSAPHLETFHPLSPPESLFV